MMIPKPTRRPRGRRKVIARWGDGTELHEDGRFHKFGAQKTEFAGRTFPSKLQADTFGLLRILESAGEISDIQHEVEFRLEPFDIIMRVDFLVFDKKFKELVAIEAKGFPTADWKVKVKVWAIAGPYRYRIYAASKKSGGYPEQKGKDIIPAWMTGPVIIGAKSSERP